MLPFVLFAQARADPSAGRRTGALPPPLPTLRGGPGWEELGALLALSVCVQQYLQHWKVSNCINGGWECAECSAGNFLL